LIGAHLAQENTILTDALVAAIPVAGAFVTALIVGIVTLKAARRQADATTQAAKESAEASIQAAERVVAQSLKSEVAAKRADVANEIATAAAEVYMQNVTYVWDRFGFGQPQYSREQFRVKMLSDSVKLGSKHMQIKAIFPDVLEAYTDFESKNRELNRLHYRYLYIRETGTKEMGELIDDVEAELKGIRDQAFAQFSQLTKRNTAVEDALASQIQPLFRYDPTQ
jgi:mannitol-specific phosphotransferase system IIBC component